MPAIPTCNAKDMSFELFAQEYAKYQIFWVRNNGPGASRRRGCAGKKPNLKHLRNLYERHPKMVRNAFCLESAPWKARDALSPSHSEVKESVNKLLGCTRSPPGPWYASFVVQHNKKALSAFLAEALPAGAPDFLIPQKASTSNRTDASESPHHSDALWVFFGRNPSPSPLVGRSEHTDAITHSGTWHVQLCGSKVWTLRPTAELIRKEKSLRNVRSLRVHCNEGDVLCINTRLWWHSTRIPGDCPFTLSIARDMYLDGRKASDCDMTNVVGHYALKPIQKNDIVFTEDTAPELELPRSKSSNLGLRDQNGKLVVIAKRHIKAGEWFTLSESDDDDDEGMEQGIASRDGSSGASTGRRNGPPAKRQRLR